MTPLDFFSKLPKGFGLSIFSGDQFGHMGRWKAVLEYTSVESESFRFTAVASTLDAALEALWARANAPIVALLGVGFYLTTPPAPEAEYAENLNGEPL